MLSKDEITQRALRLSGRDPNKYTGTLNDPFQEAQSAYTGPGWAQFFGGLQQNEEDAYLAGKNYQVGWGGFGNQVDAGGGAVPRRTSLARMGRVEADDSGDLNPLELQAQKEFLRQQQANQAVEDAKAEVAAQKAYNDAEAARVNGNLAQSYDQFVLSSAFVPANPITRTPGMVGPQLPGQQSKGNPTYTAQPVGPIDPQQALMSTVPGRMRPALAKTLSDIDLAQRGVAVNEGKLAEETRKNKADEALAANSIMSPEAVEQNAKLYLQTGTMPPLGMKDPNNRQRILNRAAELSAGGGGNVAANKADYKADAGSLTALQKQRDAIGAFEGTALKNIDLFLKTAGKVVDTGSPMANVLARNISGRMLGSPDQAAFDAARQVAINEIAKITSNPNLSGQLSDSARHEVEAFNPRSATLAQTVAVMRLLKQDMSNRTAELDKALAGVKGRIAQPGGSGGSTVKLKAPDGTISDVAADQVDHYLKLGATRVGG